MIKVNYTCIYCNGNFVKFRTDERISKKEFKYIDKNSHTIKGKRCYQCYLNIQKVYRSNNKNKITKKYEKTINGFLMRTYRNMKSRVNGIQKNKNHLYLNKPLLNKDDFYLWSLSNSDFHNLFKKWEKSNYNRRLTPSIDRINSKNGYTLDNIRWIEHWINSRNGTLSRHGLINEQP